LIKRVTITSRLIFLVIGIFAGTALSASAVYALTVTSEDIKDNTIQSRDIKDGEGVRSSDIVNNEIKSEDIKDGTISIQDLSPGVITPDRIGHLEVVYKYSAKATIPAGGSASFKAACDEGYVVTGGGYDAHPQANVLISTNHIIDNAQGPDGWGGTATNISNTEEENVEVSFFAACAKIVA
jgi:hypothetical protein